MVMDYRVNYQQRQHQQEAERERAIEISSVYHLLFLTANGRGGFTQILRFNQPRTFMKQKHPVH